MKGIILAGGTGSRLNPITISVSKQLLPVYDKPLIYYPLSSLMLGDVRDILIISNPQYIESYKALFGDGSRLGINISFEVQMEANGIADAFLIGKEFIGSDSVSLVLGDNIFYGHAFGQLYSDAVKRNSGATIFCQSVSDPENFGVLDLDVHNRPAKITEKPSSPRSNQAITGLYVYNNSVVDVVQESIIKSARGELEISDVNQFYLETNDLNAVFLGRGYAWFDAGTAAGLNDASNFIRTIQVRQNILVGSPEEIALNKGWIGPELLDDYVQAMGRSVYREYLDFLIQRARGVQ